VIDHTICVLGAVGFGGVCGWLSGPLLRGHKLGSRIAAGVTAALSYAVLSVEHGLPIARASVVAWAAGIVVQASARVPFALYANRRKGRTWPH
jgi:hypothetical protein